MSDDDLKAIKERVHSDYTRNWIGGLGVQPIHICFNNASSDVRRLLKHINTLEVALGTQKAVMRVAKEALETVIDELPHEWKDTKEFYNECMEAFKALDAALGFERNRK